jgi:hypothetical protein
MAKERISGEVRLVAKVEMPKLPNFLRTPTGMIDVADVEMNDLRTLGHAWTEALIKHAEQRRRRPESATETAMHQGSRRVTS